MRPTPRPRLTASRGARSWPHAAALALLPLVFTACRDSRLQDASIPVVAIRTTGGSELGVSTDEGILFLGRTAQKGPAKVLYHLVDAPLVEAGEIVPLGGSVYEIALEVPVQSVPVSFEPVRPGEWLQLMILEEGELVVHDVQAAATGEISGTVLRWPAGLRVESRHVGAGVFRVNEGGLALVGLLKATARIDGGEGYLVLAGLPELSAAMFEPREAVPRRKVLYRADGARTVRIER